MKRIKKSDDRCLSGVCGGIGEYLDIDPVIIRALTAFLFFMFPGFTFISYIVLILLIPEY